jgi:hypothetical protein
MSQYMYIAFISKWNFCNTPCKDFPCIVWYHFLRFFVRKILQMWKADWCKGMTIADVNLLSRWAKQI